ncbi:MAG: 16S rRNA (cytosine(1402)-N(4))-methyltransferase RsmH [Actinomycetota bacterium]|nr:16S rRNA (cytosine(1402)-N(4))-methyltransferase RsmH [Actinomycetota bacterium]
MDSYHEPVLATECVRMLASAASGLVVDGTFGGGGHTRRLLDAYPEIRIIGIDRDPDAIANTPDDPRVRVVLGNFTDIERIVHDELGSPPDGSGTVDGVLLDLGISSHQVDAASRGFSYHRSGPIDMRMGMDVSESAGDIVNEYDRDDLRDLIRRFGEERFAGRIADAIIAARPLSDTTALASAIANAVPAAARRSGHPARKTFQALRIATNAELDALSAGLESAIQLLRPGGRICVISYHSLEDRIVKRRIAAGTTGCVCPPELPVCGCDQIQELEDLGRFRPSVEEIARNPRARSAIMRVAEKVPA